MNASKKEFARAVERVAAQFPNMRVLSHLSAALKDLNSELHEIVPVVQGDPLLAAEIIRISNSTIYRGEEPCRSVMDALARIGFGEVMRIVGTVLARDACCQRLVAYGAPADEFWAESLTVSTLMEALARRRGLDSANAATIGILHALGRLVIDSLLVDRDLCVCHDPSIEIITWERTLVGFDYALAGAQVMKRWNFPVDLIYDIAYHLDPRRAPKPRLMLELLHYSVRLAPELGPNFSATSYSLPDPTTLHLRQPLSERYVRAAVEDARGTFERFHRTLHAA
ncbi:MAG: HDOD domain-containing protein [Opitutales bacterium]